MDSTNANSIVISPADLMLMEQLFSHMWPGAAPSQDPPSNHQPSQPITIHSLPLSSAQLSQPMYYSTLITQATAPRLTQLTQVTSAPPYHRAIFELMTLTCFP